MQVSKKPYVDITWARCTDHTPPSTISDCRCHSVSKLKGLAEQALLLYLLAVPTVYECESRVSSADCSPYHHCPSGITISISITVTVSALYVYSVLAPSLVVNVSA